MPSLIRFMLQNFATGAAVGLFTAGWLVGTGAGGNVVLNSDQPALAMALFAYLFASTFGLGAIATGLVLIGEEN